MEKQRAAMSKESIMTMGEYRIDFRVMCPKKRSISDYNSIITFSHKTRIVELKADGRTAF